MTWQLVLKKEVDQLRALMERLASSEPLYWDSYGASVIRCVFCGGGYGTCSGFVHEPDCLWLRAKQYVEDTNVE